MLTKNILSACTFKQKLVLLIAFVVPSILSTSCKKLIEIPSPANQLGYNELFADSAAVNAAVAGMYSYMYNWRNTSGSPYKTFLTTLTSLTADETTFFSGNSSLPFERNSIPVADTRNLQIWADSYTAIFMANNIIENISQLEKASQRYRNQVTGEAKFMRALCHFYLTNVYGEVPVITTTNADVSALLPRSSQSDVYKQVVDDLISAQALLDDKYLNNGMRTRVNRSAATALLARVYLYTERWPEAEAMATEVINNSLYHLEAPDKVFLSGSMESIFQFDGSTFDMVYVGEQFTPNPWDGIPKFVIRENLLNSFENGDLRKIAWVGTIEFDGNTYAYPNKYKSNWGAPEPLAADMVLRLSEQYLIRAEARTHRNNVDGAENDLNEVRERANIGEVNASGTDEMLDLVAKERRVELCYEWGHRWFDLKRTGKAGAVLGPLKPTWKNTAVLFPVPQQARSRNKNLSQNQGYTGG